MRRRSPGGSGTPEPTSLFGFLSRVWLGALFGVCGDSSTAESRPRLFSSVVINPLTSVVNQDGGIWFGNAAREGRAAIVRVR